MRNTKNFKINPSDVKNILIVRQHHQLGDMLCALPLFAAVRKKFPSAHISLVASPDNSRILQGTIKHLINEILIYEKKTLKSVFSFRRNLRRRKYDICIVPSTASISRTSHIISYMSGAPVRVGVNSIEGVKNQSAGLLNVKKDFYWADNKIHQTERNLDIARQIDCNLSSAEKKNVFLEIPAAKEKYAVDFFAKHFPDKTKKIFGLHLWAAKMQNRWHHDNFRDLIRKLNNEYEPYFLLTPGPGDKDDAMEFIKSITDKNIKIVCNVIPVVELAAVLKKVTLYITNDTGTMHIASYSGGKVLALFGPTFGYEWGPEKDTGAFIQSDAKYINNIQVQDVLNKAKLMSK